MNNGLNYRFRLVGDEEPQWSKLQISSMCSNSGEGPAGDGLQALKAGVVGGEKGMGR